MIVITGASGFIGSCLLEKLNREGFNDIIIVDDFSIPQKQQNIVFKRYKAQIDKTDFLEWLRSNTEEIEMIFHFGAISDTTIMDVCLFNKWNLDYSKSIWKSCVEKKIPFIYASSAATYGDGSNGFNDDESQLLILRPLNPYGASKHNFDLWALGEKQKPPFWTGLKFFNVYGPNEYHKGKMASMVFHAYNQIMQFGQLSLFKSYKDGFSDGNQLRDFIYIKDILDICLWLCKTKENSGIINIGTGISSSFNQLGEAVFKALEMPVNIKYIEMPDNLKDKYQYYTEANISKLRKIGYKKSFTTLESGIEDYVINYLKRGAFY
ncbi:MAG: ADP-glyceromanno-heptose 6-epimerase [Bacteroidetes bacterium]|nr:ADP-glyceromanno-heptose 6-epimerase [Bacteroidota bacterium]